MSFRHKYFFITFVSKRHKYLNMNKFLKTTLIILGSIVAIAIVGGISGWMYLKSTFFSFEEDYAEKKNFKELTVDGYTFLDRNANGKLDVYEDARASTQARVEDALSQMKLEEKIHLLKGSGIASAMGEAGEIPGTAGTIVATPRLGLPTIYLSDGPAGVRIEPTREGESRTYYCTAFPIATLLASTWNTDLVNSVGNAMGSEAKEYGIDVMLGPGANLHRHPLCGRNFEYYSEDPLLSGTIGAAMVNGIESNGVGTSVKHYVANNQETNRNYNDALVSERAMREIYLKGFEIIVKEAQPWTIMSAYNKVNGTYVAESKYYLTDILRDEWGFEGVVMSDWFGGQNAPAMIAAGNDLLEPGTKKQWDALIEAHENGELPIEVINTSVKRILHLIIESKKMEGYVYSNEPDLDKHAKITRESATEGMVLLKNKPQTLPLKNVENVALLGVTSFNFIAGGTGSGLVNAAYTVSLEEGLTNVGFKINESSRQIYEAHKAANSEGFKKPEGFNALFESMDPPELDYSDEQLQEMASTSDVAIITIGRNAGEGSDRVEKDDFLFTEKEKQMIARTCEVFQNANKKVIVVLNVSGVVETNSWKTQPDAILLAWQGGQEGGNSVADILSGKVTPSGKLPMTLPINLDDHASNANFPLKGVPFDILSFMFKQEEKPEDQKVRNEDFTVYEEGIFVGYRHFDTKGIEVSYPFGYGLSYTNFGYEDVKVDVLNDTINVSLSVKNIGETAGKEVVQVYVAKQNSKIERATQELKAYAKTKSLQPNELADVTLQIPAHELSYWDEAASKWSLEPGTYKVKIGASSRAIMATQEIEL